MTIIDSEFGSLNDVVLSEYLIGLCAKGALPTVNQLPCIVLQQLRTTNKEQVYLVFEPKINRFFFHMSMMSSVFVLNYSFADMRDLLNHYSLVA